LPLIDQPGANWRYELSVAVAWCSLAACGRPLDVALHERLLAPLGMSRHLVRR